MYTDKPAPGIFLLGVIWMLLIGLPVMFFIVKQTAPMQVALIVGLIYLFPIAIMSILLHAAYHTRYELDDTHLEMRCGFIMHKRLELIDIESVVKTRFNARTLGFGITATGYCNRFTNGIKLKVGSHSYYLSPSDIDRFKLELTSRMDRAKTTQGITPCI